MAVLPIKRIQICALAQQRKPLLELVQRKGVVQIRDEFSPDDVFAKPDMAASCAQFDRHILLARQALELLDQYAPQKGSPLGFLSGRTPLAPGQLTACVKDQNETYALVSRIVQLGKKAAESQTQIPKLEAQIQALAPWMGLDLPLGFAGTKTTRAFIGSFAGDYTLQALLEALGLPPELPLELTVISHSKEQTCVFALCPRAVGEQVENALRAAGFALPPMSTSKLNPAAQQKACQEEIDACRKAIADATQALAGLGGERGRIKLFIDYCAVRREKYAAIDHVAQSKHVFLLTGYIPAPEADALAKLLEQRFEAVVELSDLAPDEPVPVALKNSAFAAPVEGVLASYSYPNKSEFDPSFMMALFYYFLFGMMLSDAGYGLLIVLACSIALLKFKNMEEGLSKSLHMFLYSGISTIFWGIMYGSWFGDAPAVIARTFFGSSFSLDPVWVNPIDCPMQMLMFCLLIGVIHLFVGLGCKAYLLLRQKDWMGLVADVLSWYMLVLGLILFGLSSPGFVSIVQLSFVLPAALGSLGGWLAVAGAAIIVLFGGRESKNPALRLVKGLYALYGSTSWLGDILSYSRLLALGLATGVIGQVVNQMGSMGGNTPLGVLLFILVFLVGHTLNIAINLLGAYVHTNRLQFVEFFGKFYEGGGEAFAPFAAHTQYYKFSEVK